MNEQQEAAKTGGNLDTAMLVASIVLLVAGVAAYYWFDAQSLWLRAGYVAAGTVAAVFLALQTQTGRGTWSFILSSRNEVRKMVWPSRDETLQTSVAVIFVVLLTAVMMWLLDIALFWALRGLTGQGA